MTAMRFYVSSPSGHAWNLPKHLQRVARLYRKGVIDDSSTVWINTNLVAPVFWILSARSTLVYWFDAPTSGTARLTKDRFRWAPTYNNSGSQPDLDVSLKDLPVDSMKHVTFVVDHCNDPEPVQVVEAAESQRFTGGFYQGAVASVIDLSAFDRADIAPSGSNRFAESLAYVNGAHLLTRGMTRAEESRLEDNLENYGVEFGPEYLAGMVQAVDGFDRLADQAMQLVLSQLPTPT
jgi:hypothetical protein